MWCRKDSTVRAASGRASEEIPPPVSDLSRTPFVGAGSSPSLGVHHDRHRAVVDELDLHRRAEDARLDVHALRAERLDETLDEWLRLLGRRPHR